ncbi:MAG TPA: hypothetical protein VMD74_02150, partial [Candidatus Methylomirabilis sp.]|nr:hypothetical protein [Candidatus Methylomirabilis sp.]
MLLLILSGAVVAPALADVGVNSYGLMTAADNHENIFYGNAKGSTRGNLFKLQSDTGLTKFLIDRAGNVEAMGSVSSTKFCLADVCQTSWGGSNLWAANGSNIYST